MINKMPVVGKRYRNKKHNTIIIVKSINDGWITTKGFNKIHILDFWNWFKDEQNMSKPEPKIDMKEECVEPVSIWKDLLLGELDVDNDELYLMQYDGGVRLGVVLHHDAIDEYDISIIGKGIYPKIEQKAIHANKCCSLTDFVKSFEQMQKDIEELKRK